jgi:hypothetical protein
MATPVAKSPTGMGEPITVLLVVLITETSFSPKLDIKASTSICPSQVRGKHTQAQTMAMKIHDRQIDRLKTRPPLASHRREVRADGGSIAAGFLILFTLICSLL